MLNGFSLASITRDTHFLVEDAPTQSNLLVKAQLHQSDAETNNAASRCEGPAASTYSPAAVIALGGAKFEPSLLREKIATFQEDSEFLPVFWSHIIITTTAVATADLQVSNEIHAILQELECSRVSTLVDQANQTIPEGPFFTHENSLHKCWRLWPDQFEAFQLPVVQLSLSRFVAITIMHDGNLMIPVPSRLHTRKSEEKPFNGLRFSLKDIIDLRGVKTTAQSCAYAATYDVAENTAQCAQRLLELGAVVIGKTKCTQFASSDQPTADWVDYHCPWNPRGDGYLSPRGSSTGPSVAVSAYDWVDFGIGTDTGGSIRGPAAVMGHLAIRPSITASDMTGVIKIASTLDTTGVVCRSSQLLKDLSLHLYRTDQKKYTRPVRLLCPTEFWQQWPKDAAQEARDRFVEAFGNFLGQPTVKEDLASRWKSKNPANDTQPIDQYLRHTFMTLLWKGYHDNLQQFYADHQTKFGHPPYLHPTVRFCYEQGAAISQDQFENALERQRVYSAWLQEDVLADTEVDTIMVFPCGDDAPFYRDQYRKPPEENTGYNWFDREDHQASLAGLPAVVVPVGHVPYPSKVTGDAQLLPVAISLMGGKGTDAALLALLQEFMERTSFMGTYKAGKHAFSVNDSMDLLWHDKLHPRLDAALKL